MAHVVLQLGTGVVLPFRSRRRGDRCVPGWKADAVQKALRFIPEWTVVGRHKAWPFTNSVAAQFRSRRALGNATDRQAGELG